MNLVGHYACASVPSAEVRLGAVVPDLASIHRRKVRALPLAKAWREDGAAARVPGMEALLEGVDFHHTVDRHFHRAPLFRELERAIQEALLGASREPGLKRFLPAHVLAELFLDHLLLRGRPALGPAFYRDVTQGSELLTAFVDRHPMGDRAAFGGFLDHVVEGRFLAAYLDDGGILARMNRILVRFGQRALGAAEQAAVTRCFAEQRPLAEHRLAAFVEAMRALAPQGADASPAAQRTAAHRAGSHGWAAAAVSPQTA